MGKSGNDDLHWKSGTYAELREWLSKASPQEYTREEIEFTPENVVLLIEAFEGEVNNGGIDQFFFNSGGDYFRETIEVSRQSGPRK